MLPGSRRCPWAQAAGIPSCLGAVMSCEKQTTLVLVASKHALLPLIRPRCSSQLARLRGRNSPKKSDLLVRLQRHSLRSRRSSQHVRTRETDRCRPLIRLTRYEALPLFTRTRQLTRDDKRAMRRPQQRANSTATHASAPLGKIVTPAADGAHGRRRSVDVIYVRSGRMRRSCRRCRHAGPNGRLSHLR
jgi:hypothetical protein